MRSLSCLLFAALSLAGCDGGGAPTKTRTISVGTANAFHVRLAALSEANQGLALRRAVHDSGQRCKRAEAAAFQGDYKSLKMWTLRCSDSGDWAVFLAPNGDVQLRACKDLTQLNLPPCVLGPLEG